MAVFCQIVVLFGVKHRGRGGGNFGLVQYCDNDDEGLEEVDLYGNYCKRWGVVLLTNVW